MQPTVRHAPRRLALYALLSGLAFPLFFRSPKSAPGPRFLSCDTQTLKPGKVSDCSASELSLGAQYCASAGQVCGVHDIQCGSFKSVPYPCGTCPDGTMCKDNGECVDPNGMTVDLGPGADLAGQCVLTQADVDACQKLQMCGVPSGVSPNCECACTGTAMCDPATHKCVAPADKVLNLGVVAKIDPTTIVQAAANITTNAPYACTSKALTAANCSLFTCSGNLAGTGAVQAQSAGAITVTDGTTPITIMPDANKMYAPYLDFNHAAWPADTKLTISAAGADVPAFTGTLTTGTEPKFSAPIVTPGITIPRTVPLHLAWTGGTTGNVWVTVDGQETASSLARVICSYPVAAGSGDVPVEGLMMIAAGTGAFSLDVGEHVTQSAGDFTVNLTMSVGAQDQSGAQIVGAVQATIQ